MIETLKPYEQPVPVFVFYPYPRILYRYEQNYVIVVNTISSVRFFDFLSGSVMAIFYENNMHKVKKKRKDGRFFKRAGIKVLENPGG